MDVLTPTIKATATSNTIATEHGQCQITVVQAATRARYHQALEQRACEQPRHGHRRRHSPPCGRHVPALIRSAAHRSCNVRTALVRLADSSITGCPQKRIESNDCLQSSHRQHGGRDENGSSEWWRSFAEKQDGAGRRAAPTAVAGETPPNLTTFTEALNLCERNRFTGRQTWGCAHFVMMLDLNQSSVNIQQVVAVRDALRVCFALRVGSDNGPCRSFRYISLNQRRHEPAIHAADRRRCAPLGNDNRTLPFDSMMIYSSEINEMRRRRRGDPESDEQYKQHNYGHTGKNPGSGTAWCMGVNMAAHEMISFQNRCIENDLIYAVWQAIRRCCLTFRSR